MAISKPQNKQLANGVCKDCFCFHGIKQVEKSIFDHKLYKSIPTLVDYPICSSSRVDIPEYCMKGTTKITIISEPKHKKFKPKVGKLTEQLGFNDYLRDKRLRGEV